ncbi:HpsJ family protein [Trichothermofontia sichuanensis B231]|uniref:HpsJ-like protein, cyanoexosortase A-associated n=1 Tax=Trichothermofontia sichuanensis TaxID=3045816 RepID=UPI0022461139|nr:HpsJ family protein [Trichothermofontia sichuanensis]UZQ53372.1 HpsJ family protein [Trichothermofontia sichuanensis B231]
MTDSPATNPTIPPPASPDQVSDEARSIYRLRWVGYGLLLFFGIEVGQILIPPRFLNPVWELEAIGAIVERVVVPLLGMGLIFFGEHYGRRRPEKLLLRGISWLAGLMALGFLLMVPLGVVNTVRITTQTNQTLTTQAGQQLEQLQQLQSRVEASTPETLQPLVEQLNRAGVMLERNDPATLKAEVATRLEGIQAQIEQQVTMTQKAQFRQLLKNSVKWNLGAMIASALFLMIWRTTQWAR